MAKMMPDATGGEMDMDSLYTAGEPKERPESIDHEEQEEMAQKAVVPLKVLQSKDGEPVKVGDEIVVKVTEVNGEDAEIMYAPKKGSEHDDEYGGKSPDEEIDEMNNASTY